MKSLAVVAALFVAVAATPVLAEEGGGDVQPLGSSAMRSDLANSGYRNGYLPDDVLVEVDGGANERCLVEEDAATTWRLLVLAAERDGVTGFDAGWCYRSFHQQELTYDRNCPWETPKIPKKKKKAMIAAGIPLPKPQRVCRVPTAWPGTSNHGWGRAIDIVDTTTSKAHVLSCSDPQYLWLKENSPRFGWVIPPWARCGSSAQEPWHFEWAGLSVPLSEVIIRERALAGIDTPR